MVKTKKQSQKLSKSKVKALEKENSDLHSQLEETKEEIHYLKTKLDQKYDIIDDMEHELDKGEENLKDAKKQVEF